MSGSVVVRGRAGYLLVPIIVIALCATGAPLYYQDTLPDFCAENAVKVLTIVGALEALLLMCAAFLASRKMVLRGPAILFHSWFSNREVAVSAISDLTLQTDYSSSSGSTDHLVFWGASDKLLRINPALWDRKALAVLLDCVIQINPKIQVARDVRAYFASRS